MLQNGIGIEDDLREAFFQQGISSSIISGCAWVDVTAVDEGRTITQHGNERLVLGYHKPTVVFDDWESEAEAALARLCKLLEMGGASSEAADIDVARWRKVLW